MYLLPDRTHHGFKASANLRFSGLQLVRARGFPFRDALVSPVAGLNPPPIDPSAEESTLPAIRGANVESASPIALCPLPSFNVTNRRSAMRVALYAIDWINF